MLTLFLLSGRQINSQKLKNSFRFIKESLYYWLCHYGLSDGFWKCFELKVEHLGSLHQVRSGLCFLVGFFFLFFFLLCILNRSIWYFNRNMWSLNFLGVLTHFYIIHAACSLQVVLSTTVYRAWYYIGVRYNPCMHTYPINSLWS